METHIKETARQRAARIWRNHYVQKHIDIIDSKIESNAQQIIDEDKQLNTVSAKLAHEIKAIISEHNNKIMKHYIMSLYAKKRRLLIQKLRRLEERQLK